MNVNSAAQAPSSYDGAMMVKAKEHMKLEGETAQKLIDSASATNRPASSGSVGRSINTYA